MPVGTQGAARECLLRRSGNVRDHTGARQSPRLVAEIGQNLFDVRRGLVFVPAWLRVPMEVVVVKPDSAFDLLRGGGDLLYDLRSCRRVFLGGGRVEHGLICRKERNAFKWWRARH